MAGYPARRLSAHGAIASVSSMTNSTSRSRSKFCWKVLVNVLCDPQVPSLHTPGASEPVHAAAVAPTATVTMATSPARLLPAIAPTPKQVTHHTIRPERRDVSSRAANRVGFAATSGVLQRAHRVLALRRVKQSI